VFDLRRPVSLRSSRFSVGAAFVFVDFAVDFFLAVAFFAGDFLALVALVLLLLVDFFDAVAFVVLGIVLDHFGKGKPIQGAEGQHVRCVDGKKYTLR